MYVLPRIKEIRIQRGKTQAQIAKIIGMEQTQYSRYERGENEIKVNVLIDICKALDISADYILGLTDNPKPSESNHNKQVNIKGNKNKIGDITIK